jgi:hypothetical protein
MKLDHKLEDLPIFVGLEDLLMNPLNCKLGINVRVVATNIMKVSTFVTTCTPNAKTL